MSFFGALVRTVVNVATLPVAVAKDVIEAPNDAAMGHPIGQNTANKLQQIKDEADDHDEQA